MAVTDPAPLQSDVAKEAAIRALDYAIEAINTEHVDIEAVHAELRIARRLLRDDDPDSNMKGGTS